MNWLWLVLAIVAGSLSIILFFVVWIPRSEDTHFRWVKSKEQPIGRVVGFYGSFIAPKADLPEDFELPSTAPIPENYRGIRRVGLGRSPSEPKSSAD